MRRIAVLFAILVPVAAWAQAPRVPTVDDLLMVKTVGAPRISPDGRWVAYLQTETDFEHDAFVSHVWVVDVGTGEARQLTRGQKGAGNPRWSPDGQWLAFTSDRVGDRNQLFVIKPDGGEAIQLTKAETAVGAYAWSPDGRTIAFSAGEPEAKALKDRKETLGDFQVVRRDYSFNQLWTIDITEAMREPSAGLQRTKGRERNIGSFSWSPDGARIAFDATVNPDLIQGATADIYLLTLADSSVTPIVNQPGPDNDPRWSPDGRQLVFSSTMGRQPSYAVNNRLAVVPATGGTPRSISDGFDENPGIVQWLAGGIYFTGSQKTASHLFRVAPAGGQVTRVTSPDAAMLTGFTLTGDGTNAAFVVSSPTALPEIAVSSIPSFSPRVLTTASAQARGFTLGKRELVTWKSRDGTEIEGVLIRPAELTPGRKYPLLCVIHGGPTGIDRPVLLTSDTRYYPADIWVARGALVLKVNYRGSAGYGERFRILNVRNLGVGDAWDVLSGVDYLIGKGWVDSARVAVMGWSQGGYISAFLTTSSTRFAAVSVGAGISDWATYYYNTDSTPFTINYLGADPVADPEIYRKTSPISYVKGAKTPTLIQHGELDRRVPIPNGYELRQALEDRHVPVEMVVYKGFGHPITKPKAQRAVMQHNLAWFNHYLWNDPVPDFTQPPKKDSTDVSKRAAR